MGVPVGHPFFGNQYTDGGYIADTFKYVPEIAEKVVDYSSTLISENIDKATTKIVTRQKPKNLILKEFNAKGINKNALIVVGIGLVTTVGGYFAYKHISKKTKAKKDALQSIELSHVGTCILCGEPLNGSTYVPENEANSQKAYIVCQNCGEQNSAWYPVENDSTNKDFENHNE
jgi:Zn finger protein HypA/HybF involved in hydrogenase expression